MFPHIALWSVETLKSSPWKKKTGEPGELIFLMN
jgi:hypothetical protein